MKIDKRGRIRSRRYLDTAFDQPCIKCDREDGTTIPAHYSGIGSDKLGKGMSLKVHDICMAHLCMKCHEEFDSYEKGNNYERAYDFLMCIMLTIVRNVKEDNLKIG